MNEPKPGDRLFLADREIIVLKVYPEFHLAQVSYTDMNEAAFAVDMSALTDVPDYRPSISLGQLARKELD